MLEERREARLRQIAKGESPDDDSGSRTASLRVTGSYFDRSLDRIFYFILGLYSAARAERIALARGEHLKWQPVSTLEV